MKKVVAVLMISVFFGVCQQVFSLEPGDYIGEPFMVIQAESRGDGVDAENAKLEHQCVQLTRNFAIEYHDRNFTAPVDCAANMWNLLPQQDGYLSYLNGSNQKPQVGDFIIWWQTGWSTVDDCNLLPGHVAIVTRVIDTEILVFEQNIQVDDPYRTVPMQKNPDGTWYVDNGSGLGSSYYVKGWLRYPGFNVPAGMKFSGEYDQSFVGTYNNYNSNDHYFLGNAKDNGGGPFIHDWNSIVVQDFEHGILVKNPSIGQVFPIIGGFFRIWISAGDPAFYGYPLEAERYSVDEQGQVNWAEQRFQKAWMKWVDEDKKIYVYDYNNSLLETYDASGFGIAILPGDGTSLNLSSYAINSTSAQLNWAGVTGASEYWVYEGGQFIGFTFGTEFTDTGLMPNTAYIYRVAAVDAGGNVIVWSEEKPVTTPSELEPEAASVDFQYFVRGDDVEFLLPTFTGATQLKLFWDGVSYTASLGGTFWLYNQSLGSHTAQVKLYDSQGSLLAQSKQKTVGLGGNLVIEPIGVIILGPNGQGVAIYRFHNTYAFAISGAVQRFVKSNNPWLVPNSSTFSDVVIPAGGYADVAIPFTTANYYENGKEVALVISVAYEGSFGSLWRLERNAIYWIQIESFVDLKLILPSDLGYFLAAEKVEPEVVVENNGNVTALSTRLRAWLNGVLVIDILTPELIAGQSWSIALPLDYLPLGDYNLEVEVDGDNLVAESDESNNYTSSLLSVVDEIPEPPQPDYGLMNALLPPSEGTQGHWPLSGSASSPTKWADLTGNPDHNWIPGSEMASSSGIFGQADESAWFAATAYTHLEWATPWWNPGSSDFTWEFLIDGATYDNPEDAAQILRNGRLQLALMGWNGCLRFTANGRSAPMLYGSIPVNDGQPHLITIVREGNYEYLYVDGVLDGAAYIGGNVSANGSQALIVGHGFDRIGISGEQSYIGAIDEIRCLSIALSEAQIAINAQAVLTGQAPAEPPVGEGESEGEGEAEPQPSSSFAEQLLSMPGNIRLFGFDGSLGSAEKRSDFFGSGLTVVEGSQVSGGTGSDGQADGAYEFARAIGSANVLDAASLNFGSGNFTIGVDFLPNVEEEESHMLLVKPSSSAGIALYLTSDGKVRFTFKSEGQAIEGTSPGTFQNGSWVRLVFVRDGDSLRLYANGELVAAKTGALGRSADNGSPAVLGHHTHYNVAPDNAFVGRLDNFWWSDAALTEAEATALGQAGVN